MSLALFYRTEVEVVEAECLPTSSRGGKPDPFVIVTYPDHSSVKHRTKMFASTDAPTFAQRFVIEAKTPVNSVRFAIYDRTDDASQLLATAEMPVGGPGKEVGCKWIPLRCVAVRQGSDTTATSEWSPKLRVVWQCSSVMIASEEALGPGMGVTTLAGGRIPPPESVSVTKITDTTAVTETMSLTGHGENRTTTESTTNDANDGGTHTVTPMQAQLLQRLVAIEDQLSSFTLEVRSRFHKIESRVEDIEAVISGHMQTVRHARAEGAGDQLTNYGDYWKGKVNSDPTSTSLALSGDTANAVAKVTGSSNSASNSVSALDDILKNPTKVSATDAVLLANYSFPPVRIPASLERKIEAHAADRRTTPGAAPQKGDSSPSGASKRKLEAATRAVGHSVQRLIQPL
jgi:hypothetical protein